MYRNIKAIKEMCVMRKLIFGVVISIALTGFLTGCSDDNKTSETTTTEATTTEADNKPSGDATPDDAGQELTAEKIADEIRGYSAFSEAIEKVDAQVVLDRMYGLGEDKYDSAAMYASSGATAEEIAVIKLKDAADAEMVIEGCKKRAADQIVACEDYLPSEVYKIEMAVCYSCDEYVVFCVANNVHVIKNYINETFGDGNGQYISIK